MRYEICKLFCDLPIIKGTLIEEQCVFCFVSLLPLEAVSTKYIPRSFYVFATNGASLVSIGQNLRALCS
jgi:hypothetical protein